MSGGTGEHTKPRSRQELRIAGQKHEQVKNVPRIAQICPKATAGPSPQQQLKCEEGIEAEFCKTWVLTLLSDACCDVA